MQIKKKAVIVKDSVGFPNYMTMFYMTPEERQGDPENAPDMFRIGGKVRLAVLISQYTNAMINGIPVSLPYQMPVENTNFNTAIDLAKERENWHLLTNAEWNYLTDEADRLGHTIGGNTQCGSDADHPEQKGLKYHPYRVLTGTEPMGMEPRRDSRRSFRAERELLGVRSGAEDRIRMRLSTYLTMTLRFCDLRPGAPTWKAVIHEGKRLKLIAEDEVVKLTAEKIEVSDDWAGCHMSEVKLEGLEEAPEIIYRLGILPRDWKERKDGIFVDSGIEEAVPSRGSCFYNTCHGGPAALLLYNPRSNSNGYLSFRSALWLDDWKLITEILDRNA